MSFEPAEIAAAEARSQEARTRLFRTLGRVQERIQPSNLAQDMVESATSSVASAARKGAEAVRKRPWAVAGAAGAIGLVMARGWIADILGGRRNDATGEAPEGLKAKQGARMARTQKGRDK